MVRAYLEHGMKVWPQPVRLWMAGPMFRAERPQKGRYRQFHQVNYEALGSESPILDAEAIVLLYECLKELGLRGLSVKLSSVGDPEDRARYNAYLREVLAPHREALSQDSKERLELNPMRILDSKDEGDQALLRELGVRPMLDFLGEAARAHLQRVERHLERLSVPYELEPALVRGLDYYVRTAFEVHHAEIGAQSALGGGGRYDGLSELLGGPRVPGVASPSGWNGWPWPWRPRASPPRRKGAPTSTWFPFWKRRWRRPSTWPRPCGRGFGWSTPSPPKKTRQGRGGSLEAEGGLRGLFGGRGA